MGMSTYVKAFREFDKKWDKMMALKLLCEENKVSYPKEVEDFFGDEVEESEKYLREELNDVDTEKWVKEYSAEMQEGFEIDVKDIPKEVKTIRFVNGF